MSYNIRIGNKRVNIALAKIVYRCAACFGGLRYKGAGLACESNDNHRGFIHRKEVAVIEAAQAQTLVKIKEIYDIKDGIIVVRQR